MMSTIDTTTTSQRGRDYWQHHINTWEAEGGTQSSYCRRHHLSERLFSLWKNRFIKEQKPQTRADVEFIPITAHKPTPVATDTDDSHVTITLPNGIRLNVSLAALQGTQIAGLAKQLASLPC